MVYFGYKSIVHACDASQRLDMHSVCIKRSRRRALGRESPKPYFHHRFGATLSSASFHRSCSKPLSLYETGIFPLPASIPLHPSPEAGVSLQFWKSDTESRLKRKKEIVIVVFIFFTLFNRLKKIILFSKNISQHG